MVRTLGTGKAEAAHIPSMPSPMFTSTHSYPVSGTSSVPKSVVTAAKSLSATSWTVSSGMPARSVNAGL